MKTNLIYCALTFTALCLCYSCKKEAETEDVYSDELYRTAIIKTAELTMYTNRTQITDTVVINKYIKQHAKYFNFDKTPYEAELKMRFLGADSAAFMNGYNPYNFTVVNNKYIFTSKVTISRPTNMPLYLNIFKYNAPYVPYNISPNQILYHTQDMRVGYGNAQAMILPVMSYKFSSRVVNQSYFVSGGLAFNEFDETVIPKLGVNDTLAIQLFRYEMKAKLLSSKL